MMTSLFSGFVFTVQIIVPLVLLMVAGKWLVNTGQIGREFLAQTNNLLYRYGIPGLIFFNILHSDESFIDAWRMLLAGTLAIFALYFISWLLAKRYVKKRADQGVFMQGVFRGNLAVLSLAIIIAAMGEYGRTVGSVVIGCLALLLNILAVICLEQSASATNLSPWQLLGKMFKNPIIIGVVLALFLKSIHFPVPEFALRFVGGFAQITLPLALICTGAGCQFAGIFRAGKMAIGASLGRLILSPLVFLGFGLIFQLPGRDLAMLTLIGCAPAATAGYVMARAIGGNSVAAANIIALTMAGSVVVVVVPMSVFSMLGWL